MLVVLILLLVGSGLAIPIARRAGRAAAALLPLPLLAAFGLVAWRVPEVLAGEAPREVLAALPSLGAELGLRLDGLGLLFALLTSLIGALVVIHAAGYFAGKPSVLGRFAALAQLFAASMIGLVLADDLLLLFVFWELTSVCSFLMIGLTHESAEARSGAGRALLVTGAGGVALLVGLLLLASAAGTTSVTELLARGDAVRASPLYVPSLLLVLLGAFTKSAQVPFHYWLPGAMAAPGPVSAFLHSATLVKAGVFLLARLHPALGMTPEWHAVVGNVGALTLLVGAVLAFGQNDLKRLLAFTTVAGLGTIVLLLGIGTEPALRAGLLFVAVHALYKAGLFQIVGYLEKRTGTRDVTALGGLARHAPMAFLATALAALSMSGLPPLLGAIAKELVYEAKLSAPFAPGLLAAVGSVANALIVGTALLIGVTPFFGRARRPELRSVAGARLLAGPVLLALASLVLGIVHDTWAAPLLDRALEAAVAEPPTAAFARDASPALVSWLGTATVVAGAVAFHFRTRLVSAVAGLRRLAALGPSVLHERAVAGLLAAAGGVARVSAAHVVRRAVVVPLLLLVVAVGLPLVRHGLPAGPDGAFAIEIHEALLALLVVGGAVGSVRAEARMTAVASLGIVGLSVGLLFLLRGAPDLALTQVAVESLAVLLLLAVLRRARFDEPPRRRTHRVADLALSVAVGATFTLLALAAAPDGALPPLAEELAASSAPLAYGRNVVNVILVDFRALDTLGEIFVLAIAALGVVALLRRRAGERPPAVGRSCSPILRAAAQSIVPVLALLALVLFVRGHHEPGGGFAAGLVAAGAAMLHAFAFGTDSARARVAPELLTAAGLAVALLSGVFGLVARGTYLAGVWLPQKVPAVGKLGTPLLFDAGVFLVVLGVATRVLFTLHDQTDLAEEGRVVSGWLALLVGLLAACGTRLLLRAAPARRALGVVLFGLALNVLVFTMTGARHARAALVEPGDTAPLPPFADPLPQALVLTAIVIGFALQAFALVLLVRTGPIDEAGDAVATDGPEGGAR